MQRFVISTNLEFQICGNFADSQPVLDSILRYHLNFEIQAFIFHRGINTIAGHALFAFMFRIRMISLPIHADMRLYERICAHIFPIRIVYSDQIYIDRINSIYMRFFCIFGYTYSMQISMWFHADMRSSMRINRNTYALKKTELENLYQTLTSKSEQNLFLRKLPKNQCSLHLRFWITIYHSQIVYKTWLCS